MLRILAALSALLFSCLLVSGCSHNPTPNIPTLPQQAQLDNQMSVALIHDFGQIDKDHGSFCSAVWVSPTTIMTAAHCVVGYAHMKRKVAIVQALKTAGISPLILLFLGVDLDDTFANVPDSFSVIADIFRNNPPLPLVGLDIPYIVSNQVVDVGVPPTGWWMATSTFTDTKIDLALLHANATMPSHLFVSLADQTPLVGESVTSIGTVSNNWFSFRQEVVSAYRHSEKNDGMPDLDGPFMQLSGAKLFHGDSGSGIFNERGQLVGIASFIEDSTDLSYCIHLETIRSVLIGQRIVKAHLDVGAADPDLSETPINQ